MSQEQTQPGENQIRLQDEAGNSFLFDVVTPVLLDNRYFLLAKLADGSNDDLIVVEVVGEQLELVNDKDLLGRIEQELARQANQIASLTLVDESGKSYEYQVVERLALEEQEYLLAAKTGSETNEVIILRMQGQEPVLVQDQATLEKIQAHLDQLSASAAQENVMVTITDDSGQSVDYQVVGRMEIQQQEYLLAAAPHEPENLLALKVVGEALEVVRDAGTLEQINQQLDQLRQDVGQ